MPGTLMVPELFRKTLPTKSLPALLRTIVPKLLQQYSNPWGTPAALVILALMVRVTLFSASLSPKLFPVVPFMLMVIVPPPEALIVLVPRPWMVSAPRLLTSRLLAPSSSVPPNI
jgi:hypothetical protein